MAKRTGWHGDARLGSIGRRAIDETAHLASCFSIQHQLNMSRISLLAVFGLLLSSSTLASEPLQPTGKWIINFAENRCDATRSFGSKENPVYFMIKASPTSGVVQIALIKAGHKFSATQDKIRLIFDKEEAVELQQLRYGTPTQDVRLINLKPEMAARLNGATVLKWFGAGAGYQLALGEMSQVMKILSDCRDDLRKYWNIEPALSSALREQPATLKPLMEAFSTDDYPAQAVWNTESGTTAVVMLVDEKGQLADCMLDQTSGIPTLNAMTCIVIKQRVKFRPAVGPDGKPARAVLTTRIRWEMP